VPAAGSPTKVSASVKVTHRPDGTIAARPPAKRVSADAD
jgi:hypothetical protein